MISRHRRWIEAGSPRRPGRALMAVVLGGALLVSDVPSDAAPAVGTGGATTPAAGEGVESPGAASPSDDADSSIVSHTELRLEDVVASADEAFPLLVVARIERDLREAALQGSRGGFDTKVRLEGDVQPLGFYEQVTGAAEVEQATRWWGARFSGGYQYGSGDAPSYQGGRLTDEAGQVNAGVVLPLLRGGPIDAVRADILRRELDADRVTPEIELERIAVRRAAARAYWIWVGAGLALEVDERMLAVAVERQSQIEGRVRRGAEPEIDLVDNERLIVDRRMGLRKAQRDFVHAGLALSLYLRDAAGEPVQPVRAQLPVALPGETRLTPERVERDLARATESHPAIRKLDLQMAGYEVDVELARNDALPAIDLELKASQDFGESRSGIDYRGSLSIAPRSDTEVRAQLRFEMPIQRRGAKGRAEVARVKARQVEQRIRFERDQLVAETGRIVAELEAAVDLTVEARRNVALAERLRLAQERRLALGQGNLIDVNIRERQAAAAARALIEAQVVYFLAVADYEAVIARPVDVEQLARGLDSSYYSMDPRRISYFSNRGE